MDRYELMMKNWGDIVPRKWVTVEKTLSDTSQHSSASRLDFIVGLPISPARANPSLVPATALSKCVNSN